MALDLSSVAPPWATRRVALGNAGIATRVTLPRWARLATVTFHQSGGGNDSGRVSDSGTDGQSLGNDHFPVGEGYALSWKTKTRGDSTNPILYVSGGTNTGYAYLLLEQE